MRFAEGGKKFWVAGAAGGCEGEFASLDKDAWWLKYVCGGVGLSALKDLWKILKENVENGAGCITKKVIKKSLAKTLGQAGQVGVSAVCGAIFAGVILGCMLGSIDFGGDECQCEEIPDWLDWPAVYP